MNSENFKFIILGNTPDLRYEAWKKFYPDFTFDRLSELAKKIMFKKNKIEIEVEMEGDDTGYVNLRVTVRTDIYSKSFMNRLGKLVDKVYEEYNTNKPYSYMTIITDYATI